MAFSRSMRKNYYNYLFCPFSPKDLLSDSSEKSATLSSLVLFIPQDVVPCMVCHLILMIFFRVPQDKGHTCLSGVLLVLKISLRSFRTIYVTLVPLILKTFYEVLEYKVPYLVVCDLKISLRSFRTLYLTFLSGPLRPVDLL
jgi:hypothetical protein